MKLTSKSYKPKIFIFATSPQQSKQRTFSPGHKFVIWSLECDLFLYHHFVVLVIWQDRPIHSSMSQVCHPARQIDTNFYVCWHDLTTQQSLFYNNHQTIFFICNDSSMQWHREPKIHRHHFERIGNENWWVSSNIPWHWSEWRLTLLLASNPQ